MYPKCVRDVSGCIRLLLCSENLKNKLSVHSEIDIGAEEGKDSRIGAVYVVEGRNTL